MPTLETGTSIILPTGTTVQIAGDVSLVNLRLSGAAPGVLVNREAVMAVDGESVLLPRGAYVRLAVDATVDEGVVPAGTTVFVVAGSYLRIVAKATDEVVLHRECSCDFPWFLLLLGSVLSIVVGGLALGAIRGKE